MASLGDTTIRLRAQTAQFNRNIRAARSQLRQFGNQADRLKRTFTGLGAALVGGLGLQTFVRTIADFEKSMAGVQAVTRATSAEMEVLTETARSLGATTEFSATQAADALRFLGQAGFSAAEAVSASSATLDLATAGTLDLAEAADIASNVMSGFGVAATDAGRATDVLAAIASRANTNVRQIGEAMAYVAPVARAMGVSLETSAAALGVLGDAGIQASSAGTALRASLASLANPSGAAAAALERMGLAMEDINPATNNFIDIIERMADAGLSAADALTIFGNRAAPAVLALTAQVPRLRELEQAMQDAGGEAARMAQVMRDNLGGDLDTLGSSLQELVLSIGDAGLTGVLRTAVQGITDAIRFLAEQAERIVAYLGAGLIVAAGKAALAFRGLAVAVLASGNAFLFLRGALIRTGIGAAIVLIGELIYRMQQVDEQVGNTGQSFRLLWAVVVEFGQRAGRTLKILFFGASAQVGHFFAFITRGISSIIRVITLAVGVVEGLFSGTFASLGVIFNDFGGAVVDVFNGIVNTLAFLLEGFVNTFLRTINAAISATNSISDTFGGGALLSEIELVNIPRLSRDAEDSGETIGQAFQRGFGEAFRGRTEGEASIKDFNDRVAARMSETAAANRDTAIQLQRLNNEDFTSFEALIDHFRNLKNEIREVNDGIEDTAEVMDNTIKAIDNTQQSVESLATEVEDLTEVNERYQRIQAFSNRVANTFTDSLRGVINGTQSGKDAVRGFIVSLADLVLQYTVLIPLAQSLATALSGGIAGSGFAGAFASGGFGRGLALVGERGPELVDLGSGSRVYSNDQLAGAMAGGSPTVNNTFNINSSDGPGVRAAIAQALPSIIDASVNTIINDSSRPGAVRQSLRGY